MTQKMDCPLRCDMPERDGFRFEEVPTPRHAWGDVLVCPNIECDRRRSFLAIRLTEASKSDDCVQ